MKHLLLALALFGFAACGPDNISDCDTGKKQIPCTEKSAEEKGRAALDARKFEQAAEYFVLAIEGDPENYNLYTLLSTSYAGAAGFRLLDVTRAQMGGQGSILELMSSFLPTPTAPCSDDEGVLKSYLLCIDAMEAARVTADLPAGGKEDAAADYYKTASKQMLFYGAASTVMQINRFSVSSASGGFDPAQLATMTEEDAVNILTALASAGSAPGLAGNEATEGLQAKIVEAQAQIQSQPGATTRDKVSAFIASQNASSPPQSSTQP